MQDIFFFFFFSCGFSHVWIVVVRAKSRKWPFWKEIKAKKESTSVRPVAHFTLQFMGGKTKLKKERAKLKTQRKKKKKEIKSHEYLEHTQIWRSTGFFSRHKTLNCTISVSLQKLFFNVSSAVEFLLHLCVRMDLFSLPVHVCPYKSSFPSIDRMWKWNLKIIPNHHHDDDDDVQFGWAKGPKQRMRQR